MTITPLPFPGPIAKAMIADLEDIRKEAKTAGIAIANDVAGLYQIEITALRSRLVDEMTYSAQLHDVIDDMAEKIQEAAELLKKLGLYEDYVHKFEVATNDPMSLVKEWAYIAKIRGESFEAFDNLIALADTFKEEESPTDEP